MIWRSYCQGIEFGRVTTVVNRIKDSFGTSHFVFKFMVLRKSKIHTTVMEHLARILEGALYSANII